MSNVSGQGTVFNLPNYAGMLFTADAVNTPILTAIGGLNGGKTTDNFEFSCGQTYSNGDASQPSITETASLTAPTAVGVVRSQISNVTQIFHEKVSVSYVGLSNNGRLQGMNTEGARNGVASEKDFQIACALQRIARNIEYSIINGEYNKATASGEANKTRGLLELCASNNTVDASSEALSKALMDELFTEMFDNGATFSNCVIFTGATQKKRISDIYGYAPTDRNVGGTNIKQIETDFGNIGVALNRFMPSGTILVAEMSALAPVFQPVPEKGNFFYEELAKSGASEDGQIFGQFGLDHGAGFLHGSITNLATA